MIENKKVTNDNYENTEEENFKVYCAFDSEGESFQKVMERIIIGKIILN